MVASNKARHFMTEIAGIQNPAHSFNINHFKENAMLNLANVEEETLTLKSIKNTVKNLIKDGKSSVCFNGDLIFFSRDEVSALNQEASALLLDDISGFLILKGNIVYDGQFSYKYENGLVKERNVELHDINAVKIEDKTPFFILNGDNDQFGEPQLMLVEIQNYSKNKFPVLSFECVRQFYGEKTTLALVAKKLATKELQLVDYTLDETKKLTANEKKKKRPIPPTGFTKVGDKWHRSGTVLLYDTKNKFSILVGQDEGTYFGCQLADNPKTVEKAFLSLMPAKIRNLEGVLRQGEWFAVPIDEKNIPKVTDCILFDIIVLPIDDENSNYHRVESGAYGRIGKDGTIYADSPSVYHDEHQTLYCEGWVYFVKNTAVRSVSVDGVD